MSNDRIYYYYDPVRQGYDTTLWKTLSGTPAVVSSVLRFTSAAAIGYADIFKGDVTFNLTVPVAPVAGQDKQFGFYQPNLGAFVGFDITGAVFSYKVVDGLGNSETTAFTWQAAWTATPAEFKVSWNGFSAAFYVNDIKLGVTNNIAVSKNPLSIYIRNGNADNLDMKYFEGKMVQNYI
jgi:hypothetical protein